MVLEDADTVTKADLTAYEQIKAQIVQVAKSGGDYTTIQAAIDSITDNAIGKQYVIHLHPGAYNENITLKDYVHLKGVGQCEGTIVWANTGNVINTVGTGEIDISNITIRSTPTAPGARLLFINTGCIVTGSFICFDMNPTGTYATAVEVGVGSLTMWSCEGSYTQTGAGGGDHIGVYASGALSGIIGHNIDLDMVVAADDDIYGFRTTSNLPTEAVIGSVNLILEAEHATYSSDAYGIYHTGSADHIHFMACHLHVESTGAGPITGNGTAIYINNGVAKLSGTANKIRVENFANNYYANIVNAGDTLVSHFDSIVAVDGVIGAGNYFYANSPAEREFQAKKIFAVGGAGTFTLTNYGLIAGEANTGSIIQNTAQGSFAAGFANRTAIGTPRITASGDGGFAQGYARSSNVNQISEIIASGSGAFAQGYTTVAAGSTQASYIRSSSEGTFAQGAALQDGVIEALEAGSFAQGYALGTITSGDPTAAYIVGANPQGGTFAQGAAQAGQQIAAKVQGAFAQGFAYASGATGGSILSIYYGTFAQGFAWLADIVSGTNYGGGSFAQGFTGYANIEATGLGSFAQGATLYGTYAMTSTGYGSFAQGYAGAGGVVTSSGEGSFAQGSSRYGAITATGLNSVQFGVGANAQPDSLQVGAAGLRFRGTVAATPPGVQNGDIWVNASGEVVIRSNGVNCVCTNAVM